MKTELFNLGKQKLLAFFPRGRMREHEDGQAVLRARNKRFAGDFVYLHGNHVAIYCEKSYGHWRKMTRRWQTGRAIPCADGEGVICLIPAKGTEEALQAFMRRQSNPMPATGWVSPRIRRDSAIEPLPLDSLDPEIRYLGK